MGWISKFIFGILTVLLFSLGGRGESYSPQVIKVYDESEVDELVEAGTEILRRRGDILLCLVPADNSDEVIIPNAHSKSPRRGKGKFESGHPRGFNVPTLDMAVKYFDASSILSGEGFESPYTGKGVVVGICDIGFDPLHPNFLDADGNSRVKRLTQYIEKEGIRIQLEGNEAYETWATDDAENYHATHVCGILVGSGAGSPYVGIARDADIVVSTSTLSDVGLLAGVEDIIDYAKEVGKPAVINLSMGNYLGPHDGSSLFSQYLDLCAEDAIIVLSAGNEGNHTNTLYYQFTESDPEVSFRLGDSRKWTQVDMYGATDIWSGSSQPLSIRINVYDDENGSVVYSYPELSLSDYDSFTFDWNQERPDFPALPFEGYLTVYGGVDPENGRYQSLLVYDFCSLEMLSKGWAKYVVKVDVIGTPGDDVDVFADGSYTRLIGCSGSPSPSSATTISDLACGFSVISAGMYGNRSSWSVTDSSAEGSAEERTVPTGYVEAKTVVHSSYGTLRDGRSLPLTVAPGAPLVSSFSRPYVESHPDDSRYVFNGVPWISESGTSMASPYVAGFIATWLEAVPDLTVSEVQSLIESTNRHDIDEPDNPRNINGWFDPRSALLEAFRRNGIDEVPDDTIFNGNNVPVNIFSIDGSRILSPYCDLPPGIYILRYPSGQTKKIIRN